MPKLTNQKAMKRYDFRAPVELIDKLYQMQISVDPKTSKPKDISTLIHEVIDTIICSGSYMKKEKFASKTSIEKTEFIFSHYSKTVFIHFRENPDKIKFLQYFYRIKKNGYDDSDVILPSPSAVIRACIYDICENKIEKSSIAPSDTICPYTGQKNKKMNEWLNYVFKEISDKHHLTSYCEPFMGSANVFLHLDDALPFTRHALNDLDPFTFSLIQMVKTNLSSFIASIGRMPCNETEFNYITDILYPASINDDIEKSVEELTPMQKAVYLYYHHLINYRASKKSIQKANTFNITQIYKYDDFAFPLSASFYNPLDVEKADKNIIEYQVEHNLTNYFALLNRTRKLAPLSCKLQSADIYNLDFEKFLKRQLKVPHTLFYIDSPYFYSEDVYAQNNFDHKKLVCLVKQIVIHQSFFVMSNRVTVSSDRKDKGLKNQDAIDMANKYYADCGYHYELLLFEKKKNPNKCQVEILISNFPFTGSTPYDHNITEEEVNNCISNKKVSPNCFTK